MKDLDFELIDNLFSESLDKEKEFGREALCILEQTVILIWGASGIIENGGFAYFYEQEFEPEEVAAAYDRIGCRKCAELIRISLSLFPEHVKNASREARVEFIGHNEELFYNLSCLFWEADKQMQPRLLDFVRQHSQSEG